MDNAGVTFNRFRNDPAFQQGFSAGGSILGGASLVLGRYGSTVSTAPYDPESEIETALDQESDLENWARTSGYWHDNLLRFLDRIAIQNTLCPQASLKVEGFSRDAQGDFVFLLRQRFFREAHKMSETEIMLYMRCLGFQVIIDEPYHIVRYYSKSVIVEDLHPGNIWMTEKSNVVIIDAYYRFNTPGLNMGGTFLFG